MKQYGICCIAVLCILLSGCAGGRREIDAPEPPDQEEPRQEAGDQPSGLLPREEMPEAAPEDSAFAGRWQAVEAPQYHLEITGQDDGTYVIEVTCASRETTVWQVSGAYDETWEGIAYVGAKYEEVVREDGSVDRVPVPEREEITGMVYLEEDGVLRWIEDFDHAGDDLSFTRESPSRP